MKPNLELLFQIAIVSLSISIVIGLILYFYLPKEQKISGFLTVLSIGIMLGAFIPQLTQNELLKGKATDPILAIFLILTSIGVLLRIPALRLQLGAARATNKALFVVVLITISNLIPLLAHNIWQWQGAIFDTHKAIVAKEILHFSAPITSIVTISLIIWLFSVKK
tara:strand:+ start:382 stop:879 length:498 start_codon:yes stop_codon:yes gene_type:complete